MIKINNNIILEINGKYFNTFETNISNVNNTNKKKYKNVTKTILKLQDIYGIELNVNYILNETENEKEVVNKPMDNKGGTTTKNIFINKKFLKGGSWSSTNEKEEEKEGGDIQDDIDTQDGGQWGVQPFQRGGQWPDSMTPSPIGGE